MTSGHDVADARLHREVDAMVAAGLAVEVLGLGRQQDGPAGARVRTWDRGGLPARGLRALTLPWRARGRVLLVLDPDVAATGLLSARLRRRRLVADVHEDYAALLRDRSWARGPAGLVGRAVVALATRAAARADLTVVADDHVPPAEGSVRQRLVVRNVPSLRHVRGDGEQPAPSSTRAPRAVYVGDVRTSRGLRTMLEAVAAAPGWELDLVGPVAAADAGWLEQRAADPDMAGRVRVHGRRDPAASWRLARGADVGMVLLEDTPAFREALPTKVGEYLAAGLAVLATPLPRVAEVVGSTGGGVLVPDAAAAAATLTGWSEHPETLAEVRAAARAAAAGLLEEDPYEVLAEELTMLARGPGAGRFASR